MRRSKRRDDPIEETYISDRAREPSEPERATWHRMLDGDRQRHQGEVGHVGLIKVGKCEDVERRRENRQRDQAPWHFLYFLPEPQKQGSLRPILWGAVTGWREGVPMGS